MNIFQDLIIQPGCEEQLAASLAGRNFRGKRVKEIRPGYNDGTFFVVLTFADGGSTVMFQDEMITAAEQAGKQWKK